MHAPSATNLRHRTTCFTGDPSGVCCMENVSCVSVRSRADCSIPTIGNDQQQPTWYALTRREQRAITAGCGRTTTGHAARLYCSQETTHVIGVAPRPGRWGPPRPIGVVGAVRSRCRTSGRLTRGGGRARTWKGASDLWFWGRSRIVILEGGNIDKPLPSNLARSPDSPPQVSAASRCIRVGGGVSPLPPAALSQLRAPAHLPSLARAFHGHRCQWAICMPGLRGGTESVSRPMPGADRCRANGVNTVLPSSHSPPVFLVIPRV
jgi:hypothetical protein